MRARVRCLRKVVEDEVDFGERCVRFRKVRLDLGCLLERRLRPPQGIEGEASGSHALEVALAFEKFRVSLCAALAR
jgi:hypothetical protein